MIRVEIYIKAKLPGRATRDSRYYSLATLKKIFKGYFSESRISIRITHETCDTCGDWVDLRLDPGFRAHNHENYERHVKLSHSPEDAKRIIAAHYRTYGK